MEELASKQRIAVVLCRNSDGSEKHKAWIIGKSQNPRCFKNIDMQNLSYEYTSHKSSWIDAKAFREWLLKINRRMTAQHRTILLTLDNCAAHKVEGLELSNIKTYFFPANTSRLQPLDQGIIANLKSHYRARLVKFTLRTLETEGNVKKRDLLQAIRGIASAWNAVTSETIKRWDLLQAIRGIASAWNAVTSETIKRCFHKAWSSEISQEITDVDMSPPEEWALLTITHPINVSFQDFVEVDSNVLVCSEPLQTEPLENDSPQLDSQTISSDESDEEITKPSRAEVNSALSTLPKK
ncbi:DDE superfamily endonuclease [Popillia japonica]|uniref:DDE superfamily endonuclease n=1 Tax=Popillia japonica TaxID=7064 RepID=A0AAW1LNV3_POPJA